MKEWIVSIGAVIILTSIIYLILPNGKLNKFIKTIFAFIIILTIIKPIYASANLENKDKQNNSEININDQTAYLNYISYKKKEDLCHNCIIFAKEIGIENVEFDIIFYTNNNGSFVIEKLLVNLENAVINSNKEHIILMKELEKNLSEYLQIDKQNVVIYGK